MEKQKNTNNEQEEKKIRVPLPKNGEVIGIIEQRLGGNKMMVSCLDGKSRNSRVPGRLKRKLWLRPGDAVIVKPWEFDDNKADILLKYTSNQVNWLRNNGYLDSNSSNEF